MEANPQNQGKILRRIHRSLRFFSNEATATNTGRLVGGWNWNLKLSWMIKFYCHNRSKLWKDAPRHNTPPINLTSFITIFFIFLHPKTTIVQDFGSFLPSKFTHFPPSFQLQPRCLRRRRHGLRIIRGCDGNFFVHAGGNFGNQQHLEERRWFFLVVCWERIVGNKSFCKVDCWLLIVDCCCCCCCCCWEGIVIGWTCWRHMFFWEGRGLNLGDIIEWVITGMFEIYRMVDGWRRIALVESLNHVLVSLPESGNKRTIDLLKVKMCHDLFK